MNAEEALLPHLNAAHNLASWLTRNPHDAQDVVQEAFLRALKFFGGFNGSDGRSWFLTIVRNTYYTWRKQNKLPGVVSALDDNLQVSEAPDPERSQVLKSQSALVMAAVDQLPTEFREVIVMREFEELSYKEISLLLHIPIGTVMSRLARARKRLKKSWGNNGSNEMVYTDERKESKTKRRVMKKFFTASTKVGMLLLLSVAALAASAKAQTVNGLRANIPFDFTVAGKRFAAGHYLITRASQTNGDLVLAVNSLDEHLRVFPITSRVESLTARDNSVLIFHRYGDEYFLAQVWAAGSTTGRAFAKSRRERQLAQEQQRVGANDKKALMVETVTLAY